MNNTLLNALPETLKRIQKLEGWCSPEKCQAMASLVLKEKPSVLVEIGMFGGRSVIAQALALQILGAGVIYGIDPWTKGAALEGTNDADNAKWWRELDLAMIHEKAMLAVGNFGLWQYIRILAAPSQLVTSVFSPRSIDILHIDGNHSEEASCRDVVNYLPRVKKGGYVWMDDADWPTMRKAIDMMDHRCERVQDCGGCRLYRSDEVAHEGPFEMPLSEGVHEHGYWLFAEKGKMHQFDQGLAEALMQVFAGMVVVDIGCGPGEYVRRLRPAVKRIEGFDGNPNTHGFETNCGVQDFSQPVAWLFKYDWAMALEVGEHIPQKYEQTFLDNVASAATEGIIMSWAVPGQGGHGHFNERPNEYVIGEMERRGWKRDDTLATWLRERAHAGWFKSTVMAFRRR